MATVIRIARLLVGLSMGCALSLAAAQPSAPEEGVGALHFAWSGSGHPAMISLRLQGEAAEASIEAVTAPPGARLLGFGIEGERSLLVLYLAPEGVDRLSFDEIGLDLSSGVEMSFRTGPATVVGADGGEGPLRFERSLSVPAGGLYLAAVLRNSGATELLLRTAEYLPAALSPGRLLATKANDPGPTLELLEQRFTPEALRQAERLDDPAPFGEELLASGFTWLEPSRLEFRLAPGEAVVLAWTPAALPQEGEPVGFALQPVVSYSATPPSGERYRLGLPVVARGER